MNINLNKEYLLMMKRVSSITVVLLFFLSLPLYAEVVDWGSTVQRIEEVLNSTMESYRDGRVDEARKGVTDAYFNLFEGEGMENAVSLYISDARKSELEGMFGDLRGSIAKKRPLPEIEKKKELLVSALKYDASRLPAGSARKDSAPSWLFLNSLIIILREGFEAILVISALSAYLLKTGRGDRIKTIYTGTGLALVASLLTAIILNAFLMTSMATREAMEGVTMLLATVVLFYVSYWLITKAEIKRWHHYIQSKVDHSLGKGSVFALGFTAFLAVYREGAETVLFYQALYSTSGGNLQALLGGFVLGSLLLLGLFFIIKYASIRIPLGVFFTATSALLYYLAISFAGKGIRELQEAEWLPATTIEWFPSVDLLGFYPTWEGLLAQSVLILALVAALKTRGDGRLKTAGETKRKNISATIEQFFVRNRKRFGYIQAGMLLLLLLLVVIPTFLPLPSEEAGLFNNFTLFARYLMWGLWFPLVFVSVIVFGRLWCGVLCPQGAASEYVSRWGLRRSVPAWLRKGCVPVLSFVVITIIGQVIGVRDYPLPAMEVFIITTLLAVFIGILFSPQRRVWCRYLCPMGPLLGIFSRLGAVSFEKNSKGGRGYLCPTYIKTQTKRASSDCIECFKCVHPGEFSSLHFSLRYPGQEIEEIEKRDTNIWEVIFLFAATGLALGAFHWQANPHYLRFKQILGILFMDLGLIDIVGQSGPKWLIVNYPEAGEVFTWLDLIGITASMLIIMLGVTAVLFLVTALSALMLRKGEPVTRTITTLGYLYAPVALVSLVLGMGQMLFGSLGEIGFRTGMFQPASIKTIEGIFFAGGGLWSLYLARKLQGRLSPAIIPAVIGVGMIAFLWHEVLF